ncbi:MAG: protein kinase, partial [Myxococcota bacterium]
MDLANGVHIDRYQVEAKLRATPLATVYRVRHVDESVRYALKVLHLDRPTLQDRILTEGRAQSQLRHPNVVAVIDVLDIGGNPGLLSEFVHGPTLEAVLSRVRVDLDVVEQLVPGILAGVAAAHERQVVHRDLKPANIFIDVTDGAFVPKIADF